MLCDWDVLKDETVIGSTNVMDMNRIEIWFLLGKLVRTVWCYSSMWCGAILIGVVLGVNFGRWLFQVC